MTPELDRLLAELEPGTEDNLVDRLSFGLLCVGRVAHLLERAEVLGCLEALRGILANPLRMTEWPTLVERDAEVPPFETLLDERHQAHALATQATQTPRRRNARTTELAPCH